MFYNSGVLYSLFTGTIVVCGIVIGITAYASSQANFDSYLSYTQASKTYDMGRDSNGFYSPSIAAAKCPSCGKVHGAPGPVMGVTGLPLIAVYGAYVLWRRRKHS